MEQLSVTALAHRLVHLSGPPSVRAMGQLMVPLKDAKLSLETT